MNVVNVELEIAPHMVPPEFATSGSAAVDLRLNLAENPVPSFNRETANYQAALMDNDGGSLMLRGPVTAVLPTQITAIKIPQGYAGLVQPRSGLAANDHITVLNSPGLIDSDYRGPVKVILNFNPPSQYNGITLPHNMRIAQLRFVEVPEVNLEVVDQLSEDSFENERGEGGFGSTGTE